MKEFFVAFGFITMVLSPCLVAMRFQLHRGADESAYSESKEYEEEHGSAN